MRIMLRSEFPLLEDRGPPLKDQVFPYSRTEVPTQGTGFPLLEEQVFPYSRTEVPHSRNKFSLGGLGDTSGDFGQNPKFRKWSQMAPDGPKPPQDSCQTRPRFSRGSSAVMRFATRARARLG